MELTLEEKLDLAIKNYEIAMKFVVEEEVRLYMQKGLSEDDASIIVGEKASRWLKKNS